MLTSVSGGHYYLLLIRQSRDILLDLDYSDVTLAAVDLANSLRHCFGKCHQSLRTVESREENAPWGI